MKAIKVRLYNAAIGSRGFGASVWLLSIIVIFAIISSRAMPLYSSAVKLEREEELKFILKSYKRAVVKYARIYGSGPRDLSELIKTQPNPRFLRALYDDPFYTGEIRVRNKSLGFAAVRNSIGEIVNVKSLSRENSVAGAPYCTWFYDLALKFNIERR